MVPGGPSLDDSAARIRTGRAQGPMRQARPRRRKGRARRAVFAIAPLGLCVLFALPARKAEPATLAPLAKPRIVYGAPATRSQPDAFPLYLTIETGDMLASLFVDGGLEAGEAHELALEFGKWADLRRLRPGDLVRFLRSSSGVIQEVQLRITGWGDVRAERGEAGRFAVRANQPAERRIETIVSVPLESSLWEAVERSGETPQQVVPQLADMFQWDVDLFQIDRGDWVSFVVDRRYVGDDLVGYGPIRAALFHHQGETYEAFRHEAPAGAGYYTRAGTPVRKQFLRAPLKFTRITSGFSHRRYHPILRRFRPHYGVDYGAPVGTPVLATAEGVVVFAGYQSGEGKHIRIRHNSRMETGYLHLSRFAKGIRKGVRVQQGDVIGYVGMTGLSTGPHLDYRVSDNGKYLNPLQLRSITPDALRGEGLRRFKLAVAANLPKLSVGDTLVAEKSEEPTPALF